MPRVLSIAGTDPSGGAGIQADLKSIAAQGGYGMAAVTALVAQNTQGVRSVHLPPVEFLAEQLNAVSDDVQIDAVKIGMLANQQVIAVVAKWLEQQRPPIVVIDPVMVATSGDRLLDAEAEDALRKLLRYADLVTPNLPELAILSDSAQATDWAEALEQATKLSLKFQVAVLAKGGHLDGDLAPDALVEGTTISHFPGRRVQTSNTHGTGCSLSSALATRRAAGETWPEAVRQAKRWLTESIQHGADLRVGQGSGPVSHFAGLWQRGGLETAPTAAELEQDWWQRIAPVRADIDALPFIDGLASGTLEDSAFRWYLAQDALYLRDYSRALAEASRLAPTTREQAFWANSAHGAIVTELELHESWIPAGNMFEHQPSKTTTGYLNHLNAARDSYPILIAALLPCFWLYHDVGTRLQVASHPEHPYRSWLETYADQSFAEATRQAIDLVVTAAAQTTTEIRARMLQAFIVSAEYERDFFAAPLR
ncbi:hydroxymethylpyrimidine kinase [Psychromicrobium lacuslunae]|uniref:Hydroxymethylpyrimidine kinase n=1 Tax=Psychromicrobium lacuslunae TaxID=1618207 RepID=A0A0D4C3F6_9MICC|nr:hydroxymethylpyrimidine kinase [Psychromicrobium lacuslunae]